MNDKITGTIFDIKEFSLHDGPGGRVTVFFKGCPLRCKWCHNPEGLSCQKELMVKVNLCEHCGRCAALCNHPQCRPFHRCIYACPKGLLSVAGTEYDVPALAKKLNRYQPMLEMNGGGITFSGGEPLLQWEFLSELCDSLSPDLHLAIETSGYADAEIFQRIIRKMNYVMMDIKLADPEQHKKFTGVGNEKILKNLRFLQQSNIPYVLRVPLIPDITDTEENLRAISEIVGASPVELLPYNTFAGAKYPMVGREYSLSQNKNRNIDLSVFKNATIR